MQAQNAMEHYNQQTPPNQFNYLLQFFGSGSEYFKIMIVNWLLTLLTLGLYYPWARAKKLQYIYKNTALNNDRFHFAGTGNEMFKGFIKVIIFYLTVVGIFIVLLKVLQIPVLAVLFLYASIFAIIPFAIHGSLRYRMSRTTYRGIRFGYRGDRNEFVKNTYKWFLFTICTFGIYGSWMQMNIRRYTHGNIRYGDVTFENDADGGDYFLLNLKGYFLSLFTFGIYSFWWMRDLFNYYVNQTEIKRGNQRINLQSTATGGAFFELLVINAIITIFTLGFGKAWADMRTQKFIMDHIKMQGNININEITQTEEEYKDAFGDDVMDFFEIDI